VHEPLIPTERLELHHIPADGLISLLDEKSDLLAIADRSFSNPLKVLVDDEGPLPWRVPQVKTDPSTNKWFIRFIVLKELNQVIGSVSFHGIPDENGMMEIGIGIEEPFRGKGYAREALRGMWKWVCGQPDVKILRYTVSPSNAPSIAIIEHFGFTYIGVQIDEIDGPENIYEMSVEEFQVKWGSNNER
jgi:[ribosomal protein S5]-alanine N-acetyltransferase